MNEGLPAQLPGWIGGKIVLGDYDLIINGIIKGVDTSHFIITNGKGKLKLVNNNPLNEFPVGTNLYSTNFVKINNVGTSDNFSVRLLPYVLKNGTIGDTVLTGNVNCTWLIEEQTPGGSDITVEMFWNKADELPAFDRSLCRTAHFNTNWLLGDIGAAATDIIGRYSKSQSGYNNLSPFTVTSNTGVSLPLHLLQFTAERAGTNAELNWKTTNEINTGNFIIQYSNTGQQFTNIGSVIATNAPGTNSYQFTHTGINEGSNYYRLKMVDRDGNFTYSDIRVVKFDRNNTMQVFPNPVKQFITINGIGANGQIEILTEDGRTVDRIKTTGISITINLATLPGGIYIIRYRNNDDVQIKKIIKE
jgi:hypothetical protein